MKKAIDSVGKMTKAENVSYNLKIAYSKALNDESFKNLVSTLNVKEDEIIKHTSRLLEAAKEMENASKCKNIMECVNEVRGYVLTPRVENGKIYFGYEMAKYMKKHLKDNGYKNNIYSFDLPREIINADINDIDKTDKNRLDLLKKLTKFMKEYLEGKETKGLYIHGNFGSGKTYLVSAFFNELAKKGKEVAIVYFPEFLRSLKEGFSDNSYDGKFNKIKDIELLLLDDIGAEGVTSWGRDEILGTILQHRMEEHLPTFFTSNLSMEELESHLSNSKNKVDVVKARRIVERIKQLTEEVILVSKNRRK